MSHAIRFIQKRLTKLPLPFIERILASAHLNVAVQGVTALEAHGNEAALRYLIEIHSTRKEWHLKDTVAITIELLASRLQVPARPINKHDEARLAWRNQFFIKDNLCHSIPFSQSTTFVENGVGLLKPVTSKSERTDDTK